MTTNQFLARIQELEDNLRRVQGQTHERIAELQAEVNVLLERNTALQHESNRIVQLEVANAHLVKTIEESVNRELRLDAENRRLQHELTQEQRRNLILEQRLRRIGDAVVEGRVVDGQ